MTDISDAADLMDTAREALLAELLPSLPKERRYVGLMIANVMAIAVREYRHGVDVAQDEAARLRNLLAATDPAFSPSIGADLAALRKAVRAAIRAGGFDTPARERELASELLRSAAAWVAISNPKALRSDSAASSRG